MEIAMTPAENTITAANTTGIAKTATGVMSPEKLNAIFHHPDCRAIFDREVEKIRLPESAELWLINGAFKSISDQMSFFELNLNINEFIEFNQKPLHELHTGVSMLAIRTIRATALNKIKFDPIGTIKATFEIERQLQEISAPIKMAVIEDFWNNATFKQKNEIEAVVKRTSKAVSQIIQ